MKYLLFILFIYAHSFVLASEERPLIQTTFDFTELSASDEQPASGVTCEDIQTEVAYLKSSFGLTSDEFAFECSQESAKASFYLPLVCYDSQTAPSYTLSFQPREQYYLFEQVTGALKLINEHAPDEEDSRIRVELQPQCQIPTSNPLDEVSGNVMRSQDFFQVTIRLSQYFACDEDQQVNRLKEAVAPLQNAFSRLVDQELPEGFDFQCTEQSGFFNDPSTSISFRLPLHYYSITEVPFYLSFPRVVEEESVIEDISGGRYIEFQETSDSENVIVVFWPASVMHSADQSPAASH